MVDGMASISTWRLVGCVWIGLTLGCGGDDPQDDGGAGPTTGDATTTGSESSSGGSSDSGSSSGATESSGALDSSDGIGSSGPESSTEAPVADIGQCCFIDGNCQDVTELECTDADGHAWFGDEVCGICPDERTGACCSDDGGCTDGITVDKCGSAHAGPDTTCKSGVCAVDD
jgi:hypothetical protein